MPENTKLLQVPSLRDALSINKDIWPLPVIYTNELKCLTFTRTMLHSK